MLLRLSCRHGAILPGARLTERYRDANAAFGIRIANKIRIMGIINSRRKIFQANGIRSISVILLIGFALYGPPGCSDRGQAYPGAGESFPLPALAKIQRLGDQETGLNDKILLINFWATWCTPWRKEMPDLQKLSETLDREKFAVIGISVDEDSNLVREFLLEYGIRFANYRDGEQLLASQMLGIRAFPETFIVGPDGSILKRLSGERAWNESTFKALLSDRRAAATMLTSGRVKG